MNYSSIKNAHRAIALQARRDAIQKAAVMLRWQNGGLVVACARVKESALSVSVHVSQFQDLIGKEIAAQISAIDNELRALGFEPDPIRTEI